jgi:nicotinamide-nucleotide amidase
VTAEIVSVGTELLLGQIVDTHAPVMARILAECGIGCQRRTTIGDNFDRLVAVLRESLSRADIVVTIGGLGPTLDDLTRDAIAAALDDVLVHEHIVEEKLRKFFEQRGLRWTESIGRQAQRPESAELVDNPNGTAPGLYCRKNGKVVLALPGPKGEFDPMAKGPVREILCRVEGAGVIHSRTLRIVGMGESHVEDAVRDLMDSENPTVAPYAHTGEVHLRITARAESVEEAEKLIDPVEKQIRERLGSNVFGIDSTSLEEAVIKLLAERGENLALAESMTGGELGGRITTVPGSSKALVGGVIVYSPTAKQRLLGVSEQTLEEHGPVSEDAAREMAEGVREALGSTYGLAITGNAGPGVDVDNKPVGLVYIALASPDGTEVSEHRYRGIREDIRRRATQQALTALRQKML